METCKRIRKEFGNEATFDQEILNWGVERRDEADRLTRLANQMEVTDDELARFRRELPDLAAWMRPYQLSGVNYISQSSNPLVADEPGLGKTVEVIGGIYDAGLDDGPNLIVCPKLSIENVWLMELDKWQGNPVFVAPEGRRERERLLEEVDMCLDVGQPFWLVVNPSMLTMRKSREGEGVYDARTDSYYDTQFPFLARTMWNTTVVDEAHQCGLSNPSSQTARSLAKIKTKKKIAMTGTPAGGKAARLWGILHWLEPKEFTSKARWTDQWLKSIDIELLDGRTFKKTGGIQEEREAQFYKAHSQYILRRKKSEVYKEMPPVQPVHVWVDMSPKQSKQYLEMKNESESGKVTSTNILSTYSWLKQFGNAFCELAEKGKVWSDDLDEFVMKYKAVPTYDCPKLEAFWDVLEELDVPNGDEQVVVFSQFSGMIDMIERWLKEEKKIDCVKITGKVNKRTVRAKILDDFQAQQGAKIILMTTKAGGVSVNLDMANTVVFFDEDWDPDVQQQAIDRCHRASRIHQVRAIFIRTRKTVEERVMKVNDDKRDINAILLDLYRQSKETE